MLELESNGRDLCLGIPGIPKQKSFEENIHVGFFLFFFRSFKESFVIFVALDVEINVEFSWQIRKKINNLENIVSHFFKATGLLVYRVFC